MHKPHFTKTKVSYTSLISPKRWHT